MFIHFIKKSSVLAMGLLFFVALNADHTEKTKKIQVLVDPSADWFMFEGFNGSVIGDNVFAPRVAGGYYYLNGKIYPKDTIDREDTCFSADEEDSIGEFVCIAHLVNDLSFDQDFPIDTYVEDVRWDFYFDKKCDDAANNIIAFGRVFSGNFANNEVGFYGEGMPVIGTECNDNKNYIKRARAYFNTFQNSPVCVFGPQILIEIEFDKEIEYRD